MLVNGEPLAFKEWPKIYRFSREIIITEKIDGTNACVIVDDTGTQVAAQSRSRLITPESDNYGFARWVEENKEELLKLGPGFHFGEWWGRGIQRGYGLKEKRFSLFNTSRWASAFNNENLTIYSRDIKAGGNTMCVEVPVCHVVPVLGRVATMQAEPVDDILFDLTLTGSWAAPGFMEPEGVVVFHTASNTMFKKTLDKNDGHKGTHDKSSLTDHSI